jgi:hypothetical protein
MDWTTNPLVALYFAVRETKVDEDGNPMNSAVYILISEPSRYSELKRNQQPIIKPVGDTLTTVVTNGDAGYEEFELDASKPAVPEGALETPSPATAFSESEMEEEESVIPVADRVRSPFDIKENVVYDPPHISPRMRAQDSVLLACYRPMEVLEEKDCLEIVINQEAHDDIRHRLEQYGVFDKQLFPDLDGIAKWLKYRVFETKGSI